MNVAGLVEGLLVPIVAGLVNVAAVPIVAGSVQPVRTW